MEQSSREKFYQRIEAAPLAARGFFETVNEHFRRRNDVDVRFTRTTAEDIRLWAVLGSELGAQCCQLFVFSFWANIVRDAGFAGTGFILLTCLAILRHLRN